MSEQPPRTRAARPTKAVGRGKRPPAPSGASADTRPVKRSSSVWARLRYRLDNALSRGAWVVIGYLGIVTLAIVVLAAVLAVIANLAGFNASDETLGPLESFWQMLLRVVDAGTFAADASWPARLLGLFVTLFGIFIAGSLIGLIANAVDQRIDALRRGRSQVLESGHTLILGWSPRVPTIVSELVIANESEKRAALVILADVDKTEMEEIVRAAVEDLQSTRLVTRRGDPSRAGDLDMVGITDARSILIMSGADGDAGAIKATLAVLGLGLGDIPVIVEMESPTQADTLEAVTNGAVITVNSDRVIAEVTAQACRERGLAMVFHDLLDFDGDELYFEEFPQLTGATYEQARQAFEKATVMGVAGADGIELNPSPTRRIESGERIIALVEDDSKFVCTGAGAMPDVTVNDIADPEPPQHILLVGWSSLAPRVLKELDEFMPQGSSVTLVVDPSLVDVAPARADHGLVNSTVEVRTMEGGPELLGNLLGDEKYDQGILLGYREGISVGDADARTLLTLMALRRRWPKGHPPEVRLVAEVLDQRNVPIAQVAGVDDFIVSDQLASLMLAQLSENAELRAVFDELFDANGASIALRPARRFAANGSLTYGEVVAAGSHFGESVLGYRRASDGEVILNPEKSSRVTFGPNDEVVVISTRS